MKIYKETTGKCISNEFVVEAQVDEALAITMERDINEAFALSHAKDYKGETNCAEQSRPRMTEEEIRKRLAGRALEYLMFIDD